MLAPPLGSINTFWDDLLSLLKALVKRTEGGEKITPGAEQCPVEWGLGLRAFLTLKPPTNETCLTWGRGKEIVIYQLLKCISTKQGKGESGPRGTGRDHSAAQAAVLQQRRLQRPSILPLLGLGNSARVSSPAPCRAYAKDLNYYE